MQQGDGAESTTALIAIATFRRLPMLHTLLNSLCSEVGPTVDVLVVDNDPEASAREVCSHFPFVLYEVERKPGIAAARNRCLTFLLEGAYEYVIFVDDDEEVSRGWLNNLLSHADASRADVISGPVISKYPGGARSWLIRAGFFDRARRPTGSVLTLPATNNTIVRVDALRRLDVPQFDELYSMTGGSDNELFWRLSRQGAAMVWCDEAIVYEHVDEHRLALRWVIRRGIRHGNVLARLRLREHSRVTTALAGLARIAYALVRMLRAALRKRGFLAEDVRPALRGIGMVQAAVGSHVEEYRR